MEDLLENGIPQNPGGTDEVPTTHEVVEEQFADEQSAADSDKESNEAKVVEITPQSLGLKPQKVRRNFSVRMKVTNECIIVTVMRTDSDDTLTFVNNIRW